MPSLREALLAQINEARVAGRDKLARFADLYGGNTAGGLMDENLQQHTDVSRALTNKIGTVLPPRYAMNLADALGLGNEALSGGLQYLAGRPFESSGGFDWKDVAANRRGQEEALRMLLSQPSPLKPFHNVTGFTTGDQILRLLMGR